MANHAHIYINQPINLERLKSILDYLNNSYFKDIFNIEKLEYNNGFLISLRGNEYVGRPIWINSPYHVEIRHAGPGGKFIWWVDHFVSNEIARLYNGYIQDEGIPDQYIYPIHDFPSTFDGYIDYEIREFEKSRGEKMSLFSVILKKVSAKIDMPKSF